MDLDSLKGKSRQVTAPAIDTMNVPAGVRSVDDLITLLKEGDERERKKLRKALPFFVIAAVIFVIAFVTVIAPGDAPINSSMLLFRGILAVLYVFIAIAFWIRMRGIEKIDYAEPVRSFLAKAEKRYAFGSTKCYVLAFIVTLFLGYTASLYISDVFRRYFDIGDGSIGLVVTLLFSAAVYSFGFWATRKDWKKEKQEIWLQIRKMRGELDFVEPSAPDSGIQQQSRSC
jgi:hypothetical protein